MTAVNRHKQKGIVLITVLLFLAVLRVRGGTAAMIAGRLTLKLKAIEAHQ